MLRRVIQYIPHGTDFGIYNANSVFDVNKPINVLLRQALYFVFAAANEYHSREAVPLE